MEDKTIELKNRYGYNFVLEKVNEPTKDDIVGSSEREIVVEEKYILNCLEDNKEAGEFIRVGLLEGTEFEDKKYFFIDPPGGPFISVGSELKRGVVVKSITEEDNKFVIYTNSTIVNPLFEKK